MNVSLSSELERFVQRKVASGLYASASEVVREALRLLQERDGLKSTHHPGSLDIGGGGSRKSAKGKGQRR